MPLETATYISDLVTSNPAHSDGLNNADAHLRLIKSVLKNTLGGTGLLVNGSGALQAPADGSQAAPAYSFASEATLGFYRPAAGQIGYGGVLLGAIPIGGLMDFAGGIVPAGYLACDGQIVSRTTYAALYSAIGTTWGSGDGSTTFSLPNFIDRYRRHRNAGGGYAGGVGTIQAPAFGSHTHTYSGSSGTESQGHTHTYNGTTGDDSPDHTHTSFPSLNNGVGGGSTFVAYQAYATTGTGTSLGTSGASNRHQHAFSGTSNSESVSHTHTFSGTTATTGDTETRPYSATVLTCIRAF